MQDTLVALVVHQASVGDLEGNLAKTRHWTLRASAAGARVVCFPELNLTGYCHVAGIRELAQPLDGPLGDAMRTLAHESGVVVLAGMVERDGAGHFYASHLVAHPAGGLEVYRKLHLAPPECRCFTAGATAPLFSAAGITFGIQLCYDAHFPDLSTHMARNGADVIFVPHASPRLRPEEKHRSWMRHLPARAYDNGVYVLACNQVGENGNGLRFAGNALVIDPSGWVRQTWLEGEAGMLVTELRAADLHHVRSHPMRYFLPNRRTDLY
ncbi:MAG: nitrilase-related carbon-nitrogen hydrolase [Desulfosarcinaceae bacterium]|nr:nitrilase-related carbon-nitrogen hydrolase [Desulfosarcinaceae bacterium]